MKNRKRKMRLLEERIAMAAKKAEDRKAEKEKQRKEKPDASSTKKSKPIEDSQKLQNVSQKSKVIRKSGKPHVKTKEKSKKPEIWFDGVDPALIAASREDQSRTYTLFKPNSFSGATRHVAIDCEFVGVGYLGKESVLARASLVNQFGHVLLDKFVAPREKVTDYRTGVSGVRSKDLVDAESFESVHAEVAKIVEGRILIGHSLRNDLKVLFLSHPRSLIRDTSRYPPFRELVGNRTPSLRALTKTVLGISIQEAEHDSVTDARAAMCLYLSRKIEWEALVKRGKRR